MTQILGPGDYTVPQPPPIPPPLPQINKYVFAGIQLGLMQPLWGVGRSEPVTNPPVHGMLTQTPGAPARYVFAPAAIVNSEGKPASDNLYMLNPLIAQLDAAGLAALAAATKFTNSMWLQIDAPQNCQAFELDYPLPFNNGTMGLQFFPGTTATAVWTIRAFDFNKGSWQQLAATIPAAALLQGCTIGGEYTCDGKTVNHVAIIAAGVRIPVSYSQPVGSKLANPRLDADFQLDAKVVPAKYTVTVNNFQISFSN